MPTPSLSTEAAQALANRLYDRALEAQPDLLDGYDSDEAVTREYFAHVFLRLLELATEGPSPAARFYIFELLESDGAWPIFMAANLWYETPDLPPEERALADALIGLCRWAEETATTSLRRATPH